MKIGDKYLSARADGSINLVPVHKIWEHFFIDNLDMDEHSV